jgi:hypothetical protein
MHTVNCALISSFTMSCFLSWFLSCLVFRVLQRIPQRALMWVTHLTCSLSVEVKYYCNTMKSSCIDRRVFGED